jgi:crotonobetainyl-CoA:carnitine CoA-transferase CaiB-like acyl-CoA transferase
MTSSASVPLDGVRVLDLSSGIAGPYATKLLVDAGADVVKIESSGGDPLRRWVASRAQLAFGRDGPLFEFLNASKRSVVLDLEDAADQSRLRELATGADLVFESLAPGHLDSLGLGLDALGRDNPRLSLVSITPWGATGPFATRPSTEFTLQAATGSISHRGLRDRPPVAAGGRIGEWAAGTFAALGALSAWLAARTTGSGQHVDVSTFESMLLSLTIYHDLNGQWFEGPLPRAIEIPSIERAKDGWVGFCTITSQQWKDFCVMLGRPDVGEDDRYLDGRLRMEHLGFMKEMIEEWTRERTVDEIVEMASLMRIPVAPVGNGPTLLEMDHLVERGAFVENPSGFTQPRVPYRIGDREPRAPRAAPGLGEHTDEVLCEGRVAPSAEPADGAPALPLDGLRVVDLTCFWAGPIATAYLADLGADVVKVESIQRPDLMRFAGAVPGPELWEWSPVFAGANPGKRDVTLNLDSDAGMALLKRLIAGADVVIENFSARVLDNFGLGWETIRALNPKTVLVRMPAFGLDGPWRDRTGFAMTIEQASGLAWMTGYEDLPLVVRGACDPIGGMHAVLALLLALEERERSGEGSLVEVPLLETALNIGAEQVVEYTATGRVLARDSNRGPVSAPQGLYPCAEEGEFVAVAVPDEDAWCALREALGDPDWARDPELASAEGRRAAHDAIDERLSAWTRGRRRDDAAEILSSAGVPAEAVINAHSLMPNAQLEHRGFFQTMEHPVTGKTRYPGFPMGFSAFGAGLHRSPPPTLGQHNDEVLLELGLSEEEIAQLREAKVIGERPAFM